MWKGGEGKKGCFKLMDFLLATWMQNILMRDKKSLDSGYLGWISQLLKGWRRVSDYLWQGDFLPFHIQLFVRWALEEGNVNYHLPVLFIHLSLLNDYHIACSINKHGLPCDSVVKNLPAMQETWVWFLSWGYSLEEGMAIHSNTLAWRFP